MQENVEESTSFILFLSYLVRIKDLMLYSSQVRFSVHTKCNAKELD